MHRIPVRTLVGGALLAIPVATVIAVSVGAVVHAQQPAPAARGAAGTHQLTLLITAPTCTGVDGATVTVRDATNHVLGRAKAGHPSAMDGRCLLGAALTVHESSVYEVHVGPHAGPVWSQHDLEEGAWVMSVDLSP